MINSDISTSLTGRNRQIQNFTFSFPEYTSLKNIELNHRTIYSDDKKVVIDRLLTNYLNTGGFPEALKADDTDIVDQYFKDIIYRYNRKIQYQEYQGNKGISSLFDKQYGKYK